MHKDKVALVRQQIEGLKKDVAGRDIQNIYFVSNGGSLATLYPGKYIIERETTKVSTGAYSASEFYNDPPARLNENCLVILNSQSGSTPETVDAARLAHEKGALTAAFTTKIGSEIESIIDHTIYYYDNPQNPYPVLLSIFPDVYQTIFAVLDAINGTNRASDIEFAMEHLEEVFNKVSAQFRPMAKEFAATHRNEKNIYTMGAGLDYCIAYILTNCSFMESIWIDSSPIHAGEFFHGALEAVDKETPVFAFLGLGKTRVLEDRAVKFLQRFTDKLTVLDAKSFDLEIFPEWTRDYVAPLVLNKIAADYIDELSYVLGHPISSRRYMGVEKY